MIASSRENPDVTSWSTYIGRGAIRFYLPLNVQLNNDFFSQAVVIAKDVAARKRLQVTLEKKLAEELPDAVSRVSPLELGPPVGWPVQYRVSGPDLSQVRAISLQLGQILGSDHNLRGVNFDWMEPARKVRVVIDQDQARLLGLSSQALSSYMNAVMTGAAITQVRDDIYLVDVVARAQDEQRVSLDTMQSLQVPLPSGRTVPLSQIARFEFSQEYPLVWRRDRVPTLTVQADVRPGSTPEGAVASLALAVEKLRAGLPADYRIAVGGTVEESAQLAGLCLCHGAGHAVSDAAVSDGTTAQLHPASHGAQRCAYGVDWHRRGPAHLPSAARLRRDPRHFGLDGA